MQVPQVIRVTKELQGTPVIRGITAMQVRVVPVARVESQEIRVTQVNRGTPEIMAQVAQVARVDRAVMEALEVQV